MGTEVCVCVCVCEHVMRGGMTMWDVGIDGHVEQHSLDLCLVPLFPALVGHQQGLIQLLQHRDHFRITKESEIVAVLSLVVVHFDRVLTMIKNLPHGS